MSRRGWTSVATAALVLPAACAKAPAGEGGPLLVYAAGSLARPMRSALGTFAESTGAAYQLVSAGSLELARRITDLDRVPDVVALADEEVFPRFLMPRHTRWYARFARNRMVVALGAAAGSGSRRAAGLDSATWWRPLSDGSLEVGRSDPNQDPAGYRTLFVFQLAAWHYGLPGLDAMLLRAAPTRHVRAKSADLVALLQAGEIDAAWMYESSARGARLPFFTLPAAIDLGDESLAAEYARAETRVPGTQSGESVTVRGAPIRYALAIPDAADRPDLAATFVEFLFSERGRAVLAGEFLDVLAAPVFTGEGWERALGTSPRRVR